MEQRERGEEKEMRSLCWRAKVVPRGLAVLFGSLLAEFPHLTITTMVKPPAHPVQTLGNPVPLGNARASPPPRH